MNLKHLLFSVSVGVVVVGSITAYKFYIKEQPFYVRLKKQKRFVYKLFNIRFSGSSIVGDLVRGSTILNFRLSFTDNEIIHVEINDPFTPRYVVEDVAILEPQNTTEEIKLIKENHHVDIHYKNFKIKINCDNFEIIISRNNNIILSINSENFFTIEDKEPKVAIAADFLFRDACRAYGLPQHAEELSLQSTSDKLYRFFNTDRFAYSSSNPHESLYGAVPLLYAYGTNQTTGVLWLNASETYVDIRHGRSDLESIFFSESGALEFYVFTGPELKDCVRQNARLTGCVPLPPMFTLGYHQSRYSYMSQDEVIEVSNKFDEYDLPLDCIWLDIDYTDEKKYFTWNPDTFGNPEHLLKFLEDKNRKVVAIIDPHIKVDDGYFVYSQCKKNNFFVKNPNGGIFTAKCWPGTSSWIDFHNPEARRFYSELHVDFAKFRNLHIWNDMNEPALFEMKENSMPKNVVHYGNWKHRDVHNLYGFYQTMATYEGLLKRHNLRPFVLTRSHFAGSQRFAAIWTGDNTASWAHLKISIPMCLTASLAGFSLCGADIGGFVKHPDTELLQRWYQLGAWLPFFRGHSNCNAPRREPYLYDVTIMKRIRASIRERYKHLLYWYTLFWEHHTSLEPVIRPLIYSYPCGMEDEFLVGENILVCAVTEAQVEKIKVYLPGEALWYYIQGQWTGNGYFTMSVDLDTVPVFYKGGSIIPIVENSVKSSVSLKDHPLSLYIFCDEKGGATGTLYTDDGESFDYLQKSYSYIKFEMKNSMVSCTEINLKSNYKSGTKLDSIILYGYKQRVNRVKVNAADISVKIVEEQYLIKILNMNLNLNQDCTITLCDK